MPKLDDSLYIRLSREEKDELRQEAELQRMNISDVARRRMFSDAVSNINREIQIMSNRSLTQLAFLNAIYSRMEPNATARRYRISEIKKNILASEEDRENSDVE